MSQNAKLVALIKYMLDERGIEREVPKDLCGRKSLLRALFNTRMPKEASKEFLKLQDEYLQEEILRKGVTDVEDLTPVMPDIYLWQGDITTLRCDCIVNAANSQMLGCFCPNHGCIDNAIHTFAGIELRLECAEIMKNQGREEQVGGAKITRAYNLPCQYVLHTVGPTVYGKLMQNHKDSLASCYLSCLKLADARGLKSIAFCCISMGEFMFPGEEAAEIALNTVAEYKKNTKSNIKVVFDVFKESDYEVYIKAIARANKSIEN